MGHEYWLFTIWVRSKNKREDKNTFLDHTLSFLRLWGTELWHPGKLGSQVLIADKKLTPTLVPPWGIHGVGNDTLDKEIKRIYKGGSKEQSSVQSPQFRALTSQFLSNLGGVQFGLDLSSGQ